MNNKAVAVYIWIISVVVILVLAGFYLSTLGNEDKYSGEVEKITLAAYEGDTGLLPYIAQEQGFFENNGLDVEIKNYDSGKLAADALIAGDADISTSADAVLVSNSFEHEDLRVMGTVAIANVVGLIARKDRGINEPTDLAGKKIGVTRGSNGEFSLGVFLILNGLTLEDIEIVDLKPNEIVGALVSGEIDAGFTWEPNLYNAEIQLEDNALIIKENIPEFYFVLLSKKEWIDSNPEVAKRFVKALVQAESYVSLNKEEAKQFMKNKFAYEQSYADLAWEEHEFVVELSQSLLLKFEDVAIWRIENKLTEATEVPNYLNYIYTDALEEVNPKKVTILK